MKPKMNLSEVDSDSLTMRLKELELNSLVRQVPSFVATFSLIIFLVVSLYQMRFFFNKYDTTKNNHLLFIIPMGAK